MAHTVVNITDPRTGTGAQKLVTNVKLCLIFYWFKLRNIDVCVNYSLVLLTVKQPICRGPKSRIKTPAKWEGALHVTSFSRRLYTSILMVGIVRVYVNIFFLERILCHVVSMGKPQNITAVNSRCRKHSGNAATINVTAIKFIIHI